MRTLNLITLTLLLTVLSVSATAQNRGYYDDYYRDSRSGSTVKGVEWGVMAGLDFPTYSVNGSEFDVDNKLGYHIGLLMGIKFRLFAIAPEVQYVRHTIKLHSEQFGTKRIKTNSIDIPVVFSVRALPMLRINAGPVFTVMNDCKYADGKNQMYFGSIRPTVSYMLGLGLKLNHTLVDFRYIGQFDSKKCVYPTAEEHSFNMRSYSLALSVGFVF